jgi:cytochrome P450
MAGDLPVIEEVTGFAVHEQLRAAAAVSPVAISPLGYSVFLRHADVEALARHPALRNYGTDLLTVQGVTDGPLRDMFELIMFNNEGDRHRRLRSLVQRAFTPKAVEARRSDARQLAHQLLLNVVERGEGDLAAEIGPRLAITMLGDMLGVPRADIPVFQEWAGQIGLAFGLMNDEQRAAAEKAVVGLSEYIDGLIADRRRTPGDDLMTALIVAEEEGDRLSTPELYAMVANILFGGYDTTKAQIGVALFTLLCHRDQLARLAADPDLVMPAVEEILRYEPIAPGVLRVATTAIEFPTRNIAEGEWVGLATLAANRDPNVFDEPDRFLVDRPPGRMLTFGGGIHYCIGAPLARLQLQEVVAAAPVLQALELTCPPEDVEWYPAQEVFRGVRSVPVATAA